mgnify:CR=1 FL=1
MASVATAALSCSLLTWAEPITRGTKEEPVLAEVVACGPVASQGVVLDAAAHVSWRSAGGVADMEGTGDAGGVLGLVINSIVSRF